jgi:uncharacterized protein YkwD
MKNIAEKKSKRTPELLVVIAVTMILWTATPMQASMDSGMSGDFTYIVLDDGTAAITGCTSAVRAQSAVDIPGMVNGKTVTSIGDRVFLFCTMSSITIPNRVKSIGSAAFASCSNLTSVTIPASVASIADTAFLDCTKLHLKVYFDSCAQIHAIRYKIPYGLIDGSTDTVPPTISVQARTQEQIRGFLAKYPAMGGDATYDVMPSANAPFRAGTISANSLNSAVNTLNQIRYIVGIDADVSLNAEYTEIAQAAALVNAANGVVSHSPSKPSGMDDLLYGLGSKGAGSSNLARGYNDLNSALVGGWMNDGDASNIGRISHRRWILNPAMSSVGFGLAGEYAAMYVFGNSRDAYYYGVAWPAQNMPVEFFGESYPWSVSLGTEVDDTQVSVKLTRRSDQRSWTFSAAKKDGYFNVDNRGYGQPGCIIFRPNYIGSYKDGDVFDVSISGIEMPLNYSVSFFKTGDEEARRQGGVANDQKAGARQVSFFLTDSR